MKQEKWFDRKFNFDDPQNIFPAIIERLAGTPIRLEEKLKNTAPEILQHKFDGTWSIQENLGHLIDLEPLWQGRLAEILNAQAELRPTDLQNRPTDLANHNQTVLEVLLSRFRKTRQQTLVLLTSLSDEEIFKSALHPRLKTPMRTTDLFLFVAEHDDHHLARMSELLELGNQQFLGNKAAMKENQKRVKFDFEISFTNGGSLTGRDFRLDLAFEDITDDDLKKYLVQDLRLLMVGHIKITNKEIIDQAHKRT